MRANDESSAESEGPQWPARIALALAVTLLQVVVIFLVMLLASMVAANASAANEADVWAGLGYFLIGLAVAPIVAAVVGPIVAARMRLPLFGLYALPVLLAVLAFIMSVSAGGPDFYVPILLIFFGGNALIAIATARRPRSPRKPRSRDRGITF